MKKYLGSYITILIILFLCIPTASFAETKANIGDLEVMSHRVLKEVSDNQVCGQVIWDNRIKEWRPQIFPVNGATKEDITEDMKNYIKSIRPSVSNPKHFSSHGTWTCWPAGWNKKNDPNSPAGDKNKLFKGSSCRNMGETDTLEKVKQAAIVWAQRDAASKIYNRIKSETIVKDYEVEKDKIESSSDIILRDCETPVIKVREMEVCAEVACRGWEIKTKNKK